MAPLVSLLLSAGPSILRAVGARLGGKAAKAAESVASVVEAVQGRQDAPQKLSEALEKLPPQERAELVKLEVELARIEAEREKARLDAGTARWAQTQETARVEVRSEDRYVRRARPRIALWSAAAGILYALTGPVSQMFGKPVQVDGAILGVLLSPVWTYMGARTVDAFSPHKGPRMGQD